MHGAVRTLVSSFVALAWQYRAPSFAIYLSGSRPSPCVKLKPFTELLGGVPTIVYGYFALLYVTPALQYFF
jgi:phosphate transport system permease protein